MASNSAPPGQGANNPPPKPWERAGNSSGPGPFKPSSAGSTSQIVEASGTAKPGEIVPASGNGGVTTNALGRPLPPRPWQQQQQTYGNTYGGYNSGMNYGGYGGTFGGGLYGNNMYRGGYGGLYGGSGMYGGGGFGGPMGGYGMGGMPGPYDNQDPNGPFGPSSPPGFWNSFLRVLHGVVTFFGRIAFLIDQNTQAFHMFITALLQLFERSGVLYVELARFALRLLGIRTKPRNINQPGPNGLPAQDKSQAGQNQIQGPKSAPAGGWENVWADSK